MSTESAPPTKRMYGASVVPSWCLACQRPDHKFHDSFTNPLRHFASSCKLVIDAVVSVTSRELIPSFHPNPIRFLRCLHLALAGLGEVADAKQGQNC
mmetsp:Transcript_13206/g.36475  ORF Transcript_13206/g.36475 Transcript_13206/m.36475 type:complete len:97 (+) Transcript_13206:258-548(+)